VKDFANDKKKLKQMFNKTINTLELIYQELSLGYLFDRISS